MPFGSGCVISKTRTWLDHVKGAEASKQRKNPYFEKIWPRLARNSSPLCWPRYTGCGRSAWRTTDMQNR